MRLIPVLALLAATAACLPGAASAQSPPTLQLDPNVAGLGTHVALDGRPGDTGSSGSANVRSVVLAAAQGFSLDPRARAARCDAAQAKAFKCPPASRIGAGQVDGHASGPFLPVGGYAFTAGVKVFLAPPPQAGDVAGVVMEVSEPQTGQRGSVTGRVVRTTEAPFGLELRFDDLDKVIPSFPDVTLSVDRVQLRAGAHRTVVRQRKVRRHGRRVTIRRRHRYDLLTNPPTCSGAWPFRLTIVYADRQDVRDAAVGCAAG
jgi:hypothetical protein